VELVAKEFKQIWRFFFLNSNCCFISSRTKYYFVSLDSQEIQEVVGSRSS